MPLGTALETHARQRPDALAACIGDTALSYAALRDQTARLDAALRALPAREHPGLTLSAPARLFALTTGNHAAALPLLATAFSTPHAVQLLDPQWPEALLIAALEAQRPDALFCLTDQTALRAAAARLWIPAYPVETALPDLLATAPAAPLPRAPDETFLIGYTSGTTSRPKAFARSRHSWRASLDASRTAFGLTDQSHTLAPGPLAHGVTLYALAETLDNGATFHALPRFDAPTASALLKAEAPRLVAVPALLQALTRHAPLPTVTNITTAGAKLDPALLAAARATFPTATLYEYYGASELGFLSLSRHDAHGSSAPPDTVGHPFPHVALSIRTEGRALPQGATGTIFARGDLAIDGYLTPNTRSGFRREGDWATVGDLGRINPDGSLSLMGREGGMIVTAGLNVYPQEVETALSACPGVTGAVVLGLPHPTRGQDLVALLTGDTTLAALRAHLAPRLPRYKIPRRVAMLEDYPLTSSGKPDRRTLMDWIEKEDARLVPLTA
ncbi:AMP-binding protein [uncultured Shimia sp.]|uniref:AMP-binding protein n=1 Tax=uncultured Shimia sp. TaxID=573152 RepID=UPI00260A805A|nr:AMP-binding protein [uncultured Shimia sp.]